MDSTTTAPAAPCAAKPQTLDNINGRYAALPTYDDLCEVLYKKLRKAETALIRKTGWTKTEQALFVQACAASDLDDSIDLLIQPSSASFYRTMALLETQVGGQIQLTTDDGTPRYFSGHWKQAEHCHRQRMIGSGRFKACPDCDVLIMVRSHAGKMMAYCDFCDTTYVRKVQSVTATDGGAA